MKTKHAPAPWNWADLTTYFSSAKKPVLLDNYGYVVCDFGDTEGDYPYPTEGTPPSEADSKLIAAAPELLEALNEIVDNWKLGNEDNCAMANLIDKAEALIKKATE